MLLVVAFLWVLNFQQIRLAALSWNGEGSFVFTSSSAPYDCNDNGPCDEVCHTSKLSYYFACFGLNCRDDDILFYIEIHTSFPNDSIIWRLFWFLNLCNWITSMPMHLVHVYQHQGSNSPNWIYFILGYSICTNWKKPQGWHPSKCWKCGTGVWRLCSKIGRALYILYKIQTIRIARTFHNLSDHCVYAFIIW